MKCLISRRSLIKLTNLGLVTASVLYSANSNRPTYQTYSKTLLIPWEVSSLVISMMILLISELFMTSKSKIVLNISSVIILGEISIYRRCRANIYIKMAGWELIYPIVSLRWARNYYLSSERNSTDLVNIRSNCRYLSVGGDYLHVFWISWIRFLLSCCGNVCPLYFIIKLSIILAYSVLPVMLFELMMLVSYVI